MAALSQREIVQKREKQATLSQWEKKQKSEKIYLSHWENGRKHPKDLLTTRVMEIMWQRHGNR